MPTVAQIAEIMPHARREDLERYTPHIGAAMDEFAIYTPRRQAAFLANVAWATGCLRWMVESLSYSADGLRRLFPQHFDDKNAPFYAGQSMRVANRVYAHRMGNGNELSGDGYRYRGRGLLHLTGRERYRKCGLLLELPLERQPDLLLDPVPACRSGAWVWATEKNLNGHADMGDFEYICQRLTGGLDGYQDRSSYYETALEVLE
jgi:putative chitinase